MSKPPTTDEFREFQRFLKVYPLHESSARAESVQCFNIQWATFRQIMARIDELEGEVEDEQLISKAGYEERDTARGVVAEKDAEKDAEIARLTEQVERFKRMDALGISEHDIAASHPDYEGPDPGDAGDAARKAEIARLGLEVTMWIKRGNEAIEINKSRDREIGGNRTIIARLTRERDDAQADRERLRRERTQQCVRAEAAEERVRELEKTIQSVRCEFGPLSRSHGAWEARVVAVMDAALAPATEENPS